MYHHHRKRVKGQEGQEDHEEEGIVDENTYIIEDRADVRNS